MPTSSTPPSGRRTWSVYVVAFLAAVVGIFALTQAVRWYAHPFADVLVDRDACVSGIGSPAWEGMRQGLRFPDHVVAVDGIDLSRPRDEFAARALDRAVEEAFSAHRPTVHLRVETADGTTREVDLPVRRFGALEWWVLAGIMHFAALLYVIVALTALVASPRGKLARTFAKTALFCALFLLTLFESHTTRTLVPLFDLAFAMAPFSFVALALRLPDDAPVLVRLPWLVNALDLVGLGLAASMFFMSVTHQPTVQVRSVCSLLLAVGMLFFVLTFLVRYLRARDERRAVMRALVGAVAPVHLLLAIGIMLSMLSSKGSSVAFFAALPVLTLTPLSAVVAFLRNDLWGSRALVSRVVTLTTAAILACTLSLMLGAACATWLGVAFHEALLAAAAGAIASAGLVTVALRIIDRGFFPARTEYKPMVEQLSENLTSLHSPEQVGAAVERIVRKWLDCDYVRFQVNAGDEAQTEAPPALPGRHELALPVTFGGAATATLRIGRKRGGALFTSEDLDLLRTIANQAALALAYAHSYRELEERRQQQAAAWRGERAALVETLSAEIVHEVRYPINFFRSVFRRGRGGSGLDEEEIDIGCEEVDRLERLVSGLKRLGQHRLERRELPLPELAARAELLLRDAIGDRRLEIDVPDDARIRCDLDQATQVVVNLVANALDASGERGRVGLRFRPTDEGAELVVWDTGVGFDGDPAQLFAPWFTTKPRGTGLGLAITQRIVRAHGWSIDARREGGRTLFVVGIPESDVVGAARAREERDAPDAARSEAHVP